MGHYCVVRKRVAILAVLTLGISAVIGLYGVQKVTAACSVQCHEFTTLLAGPLCWQFDPFDCYNIYPALNGDPVGCEFTLNSLSYRTCGGCNSSCTGETTNTQANGGDNCSDWGSQNSRYECEAT